MGFEDRHPAVNLIFFTAVIAGTILFHHPVYLGISVVCALAYSIYRGGTPGGGIRPVRAGVRRGVLPVLQYLPPFRHHGTGA